MLKEMVKSVKMQLKSKETDIQRLNIKIKRLEKNNELRSAASSLVNASKGPSPSALRSLGE